MEVLGYLAAALIGLSLGLIGGGGSILTVPVLVYLFGMSATAATAHSLFIVGLTALIGSLTYFRRQEVDLRTAVVFGVPSILAVYAVRAYAVPAIPATLFTVGGSPVSRDMGILVLFAALMIFTSVSMIRPSQPHVQTGDVHYNYGLVLAEGLIVGGLTGLLGAGGGFLIIPALVLMARLPMKLAVGTSLVIIAAKSLIGFLGDVQRHAAIDWALLAGVGAVATAGILIGSALASRISGSKLKPAFGYFVLVMGVSMIGAEIAKARSAPGHQGAHTERSRFERTSALALKSRDLAAATLIPSASAASGTVCSSTSQSKYTSR
jgi:hypothetical protein